MNQLCVALRHRSSDLHGALRRCIHYRFKKKMPQPAPAPPKPPKKPRSFTLHETTWEDPYSWMSSSDDKVAMRQMEIYLESEVKYAEAVMADKERLRSKLQMEIASRMPLDLSTPPIRWGPWLYYRRVEEGKQYCVFCRRLAKLHEEFISNKDPCLGFDYLTGKKIEQKLLDLNVEAERFGGHALEDLSEISPDHRFLAYTMYDNDNDCFKLSVKNLNSGSLCSKPKADRVSSLAWAKGGQALLYVVNDQDKRPCRLYCSLIGSTDEDILLLEELDDDVYFSIRHTKDFRFVTVIRFSSTSSKVFLIDSADPLSGMVLIWECEDVVNCAVEHHMGVLYLATDAGKGHEAVNSRYLLRSPFKVDSTARKWEQVFVEDQDLVMEDVDFCQTHLVLILREGQKFKLCSVLLPLPVRKGPFNLKGLDIQFLPLPQHVSQISPGQNYDFYSSIMRFTISSPVMPDAVVDYNLSDGKWNIIKQQSVLNDRSRILYGTISAKRVLEDDRLKDPVGEANLTDDHKWNSLSEFYACERFNVPSYDGALVPLTVVYSYKCKTENDNPGLLHVHGSYGELLDKSWRSEQKSLLDRGWVIAYADVRGGGGGGKKWHHDGTHTKKFNSVQDYISCAKFLAERNIVNERKLAGCGYSAGGLVVASAINQCPELFRAAILRVPFLDPINTLLHPIIPPFPADYVEFGDPENIDDFHALRRYSPYDTIQKDVAYPAVLITGSFTSRFGVWEATKWIARVRDLTIYDPERPVILSLRADMVEDNRYLDSKEAALEAAFLTKMMES